MYLMLKDKPVLKTDGKVTSYEIIDNKLIPYKLYSLKRNYNPQLLRVWLLSRFIYVNFVNYKILLNSITDCKVQNIDSLDVVKQYHAVAVNDCYWLQYKDEDFESVCIFDNKVGDIVVDAALLGLLSTITLKDLKANVSIHGRFPKTWKCFTDGLYLVKADLTDGMNVYSELASQDILNKTTISNCHYVPYEYKGVDCTATKSFTDRNTMFISFKDIAKYFEKKKFDYRFVFKKQFAEMAYIDYITGNTDRHIGNYGFTIDANTNQIIGFAPLFDFNLSMYVTEILNTRIRTETYIPTGKSILESAVDAMKVLGDTVPLEFDNVPDFVEERIKILKANLKSNKIFIPNTHYGITKTIADHHKVDWNDFNKCKKLSEQLQKKGS